MKRFQFPLFFIVDTEGATNEQNQKLLDWLNVFTSDTNLRVPPNAPFEGNNRYYGITNAQATRGITIVDTSSQLHGDGRPANRTSCSIFHNDHVSSSGGIIASSDEYSYQGYGVFDTPSSRTRTYFYIHENDYSPSSGYKHVFAEHFDFAMTTSEFIDNVLGKKADALSINDGKIVIKKLERNKVVPVLYLTNKQLDELRNISVEMAEHYISLGYVLIDTSFVKHTEFGYTLINTETVTLYCGRELSKEFFDTCVDDGILIPISQSFLERAYGRREGRFCFHFKSDTQVVIVDRAGSEERIPIGMSTIYSSSRDLTFFDTEVANDYGFAYCEYLDDWVPEDEVREEPNCGYHCGERPIFKCDETSAKFMIGFEIEKDDDYDAYSIGWQKVFDRTKWIKEDDGSLGDYGYELVTPVYDLFENKLDKDIANDHELQNLIDAEYSDDCGGHINISSNIYSPIQLFNGIKAFMPLLYSMYHFRLDNSYCSPKETRFLLTQGEKYSSVHFRGDKNICSKNSLMEIRVVSAVRDVNNLIWRRDLIRLMMENINRSERDILSMMLNERSRLHKHLSKTYSEARLVQKCNDYVMFAEKYNNVKLDPINWEQVNKRKEVRKNNKNKNNNTDNNSLSA